MTDDNDSSDTQSLPEDLTGLTLDGRFDVAVPLFSTQDRTVYAAREHPGDRPVLLILFAPVVASDASSARQFVEHARHVMDVDHPAVPRVLALGALPDGRRYVVVNQVDGRTLREELQRLGVFSPERTVLVIRAVAHALAACRVQGITHGNLKPENILLAGANQERVYVLDMGMARLVLCRPHAQGLVPATPSYMAPEQGAGFVEDARSDVYTLGVIAFEMLTGRLPFLAQEGAELLRLHRTAPIPSIKDALPSSKASPWLEELVQRLMRKKPEERPALVDLPEELERLPEFLGEARAPVPVRGDGAPWGAGSNPPEERTTGPFGFGVSTGEMIRPDAPRRNNTPAWVALGLGVLVMMAVVVGSLAGGSKRRPAADGPAPLPAATAADAAVVDAGLEASVELDVDGITVRVPRAQRPVARPAQVVVSFTSTPVGVEVLEGDKVLGSTPLKLTIPRGDKPRLFVFRRGDEQLVRATRPMDDATLHVDFTTVAKPAPEAPVVSPAMSSPAVSPTVAPAEPADGGAAAN